MPDAMLLPFYVMPLNAAVTKTFARLTFFLPSRFYVSQQHAVTSMDGFSAHSISRRLNPDKTLCKWLTKA